MPKKNRSRKKRLIRCSKKCYYCGVRVYLKRENDDSPNNDNTATVEHLYPKQDIRRIYLKGEGDVVLSCHKCNHMRNEEQQKVFYEYRYMAEPWLVGILSNSLKIKKQQP